MRAWAALAGLAAAATAAVVLLAEGGAAPVAACDPARPGPPASVVPGTVGGPAAAARRHTLTHAGVEREFLLSLPAGYDGRRALPLILDLHGSNMTMRAQAAMTGLADEGPARGYAVVTPQAATVTIPGLGTGPFWNFFPTPAVDFDGDGLDDAVAAPDLGGATATELAGDDVSFLSALLDHLDAQLCVDRARVYATGFSNGAGMATTLACVLGDRLAAVAPVAGVNLTAACPGTDPVPVLAVHGDADPTVAYEGGTLLGFRFDNPSVPDRVAAWAERNRCLDGPADERQGARVAVRRWDRCEAGAEVQLWTVRGWGHAWPGAGSPMDATGEILDFFDDHRTQDERAASPG